MGRAKRNPSPSFGVPPLIGFAALYPSYDSTIRDAIASEGCYCDRYAVVAVPLATDIDSAPGPMVQLVLFRIRVENTMVTALLDTVEVELIVTSRLGR